jgi:hypothetical protein
MKDLQLHGSMFFLFKKFVEETQPEGTWDYALEQTGLKGTSFQPHANYPAAQLSDLMKVIAKNSGQEIEHVKEAYGEHLVPDLLHHYAQYIKPEWRTYEMLINTELVMHRAVRKEESKANPPVLNISRVHDKLIVIDYYSERKMASLAIGIIKGIAKYYNESDSVNVTSMSELNDERVQLRVEFL